MSFEIGSTVYFLSDYSIMIGTVISVGKKNLKINVAAQRFLIQHEKYIPFDKCAKPEEMIAVVWETWKGKNGRGGYRIDRFYYSGQLREAKTLWGSSFRITESVRPPHI